MCAYIYKKYHIYIYIDTIKIMWFYIYIMCTYIVIHNYTH